jgi:hypothetical protein
MQYESTATFDVLCRMYDDLVGELESSMASSVENFNKRLELVMLLSDAAREADRELLADILLAVWRNRFVLHTTGFRSLTGFVHSAVAVATSREVPGFCYWFDVLRPGDYKNGYVVRAEPLLGFRCVVPPSSFGPFCTTAQVCSAIEAATVRFPNE